MLADEGKLGRGHYAVSDARPVHKGGLVGLGDSVPISAVNCAAVNLMDAFTMIVRIKSDIAYNVCSAHQNHALPTLSARRSGHAPEPGFWRCRPDVRQFLHGLPRGRPEFQTWLPESRE